MLHTKINAQGSGNALYFGSSDYVDCGKGLTSLSFPFTIELWLLKQDSSACTIFNSEASSTATYSGVSLRINKSNRIALDIGNGLGGYSPQYTRTHESENTLPMARWTHIAVVANSAADVAMYINGMVSKVSKSGNGQAILGHAPNTNCWFGKPFASSENNINGAIDEVRVWSKSLIIKDIQSGMCRKLNVSTINLLAYWNFDETSGNNILDKSGNGHDGVLPSNSNARQLSGAPIGDESTYIYSSNLKGQELDDKDLFGNRFSALVQSDVNSGIHIYKINSKPNFINGNNAEAYPGSYFGVFTATANVVFDVGYLLYWNYCNTCTTLPVRASNAHKIWDISATKQHGCELYRESDTAPQEYILTNIKTIRSDTFYKKMCTGDSLLLGGEFRKTTGRYIDVISSLVCNPLTQITYLDVITCPVCNVFVPNAFSPNDDGINDAFEPQTAADCGFEAYHCSIYDRWGQLVFESKDPKNTWNGRFRNQNAPDGIYFYVFDYTPFYSKNGSQRSMGDVLIVR
jgi:gliding motility-associated-like protein